MSNAAIGSRSGDGSVIFVGDSKPYKVLVDDNFHYQDEGERYEYGEYESFEAAVAACQTIVDEYLKEAYKEGIDAEELYDNYVAFGEDPFVVPRSPTAAKFSAWEYARRRCQDICRST